MRPRDMPSRWVKVRPWYYTDRRQRSRKQAQEEHITQEERADADD